MESREFTCICKQQTLQHLQWITERLWLEILTVLMALNDSWKQFFLAVTSVTTSALEVF